MNAQNRGAALVTGAGKRIGREIALYLAAEGFAIALHYRRSKSEANEVAGAIVKSGGTAACVKADLSKETDTAALIEKARKLVGPLTLLVNSASVFEDDDITSMTRETWDAHIETNLRAPLKLAQDFAAQTQAGADNLIVNIIDQRVLKLTPQFLSYTTSKAALYTLTKTLAQALGPQGVRVNAIGPGPVLKNDRQSAADWERQNKSTILGHGAAPGDICGALGYLINAMSVTGQMIAVDGGQHLAWKTSDAMVKE